MQIINIHQAKTHLSRLIEEAIESGDVFVIAKSGRPVAKVTPLSPSDNRKHRVGFMRGQVSVPGDFDTLGRDAIEDLFAGRG